MGTYWPRPMTVAEAVEAGIIDEGLICGDRCPNCEHTTVHPVGGGESRCAWCGFPPDGEYDEATDEWEEERRPAAAVDAPMDHDGAAPAVPDCVGAVRAERERWAALVEAGRAMAQFLGGVVPVGRTGDGFEAVWTDWHTALATIDGPDGGGEGGGDGG